MCLFKELGNGFYSCYNAKTNYISCTKGIDMIIRPFNVDSTKHVAYADDLTGAGKLNRYIIGGMGL